MNSWILLDGRDSSSIVRQVELTQLPNAPAGCHVTVRRLQGGLSDGVELIEVNNGRTTLSVIPTRGMGIWKAQVDDLELGWKSPVRGPVHPQFVPLHDPTGLGWLEGFDELLCRCGANSNGAPEFDEQGQVKYPLHGRIANRPAHRVELIVDGDELVLRGVVEETRFHFEKLQLTSEIRTRFNQEGFVVRDRLVNLSSSAAEVQMLYHINFGLPLLSTGAELRLPAKQVVPRNEWAAAAIGHWSTYSEPQPGTEERVYFFDMWGDQSDQTLAVLRNRGGDLGVAVEWNCRQLPCFTQWKNETAVQDGYVTGLEPGTNYPNPRSFEGAQGRVVKLAGGAHYDMQLGITALTSAAAVAQYEARVAEIQAGRQTTVHQTPHPDWCAT